MYFIEPGWLCEIMALLVTVKENNNFVRGGIIEKSNVGLLLKNPRLPPQFMEQVSNVDIFPTFLKSLRKSSQIATLTGRERS